MKLDERGKQCPFPVIDTKKALDSSSDGEIVEVLVDNEIAVQNLRKMADHKGLVSSYEKIGDREFHVKIKAGKRGAPKILSPSQMRERQTDPWKKTVLWKILPASRTAEERAWSRSSPPILWVRGTRPWAGS